MKKFLLPIAVLSLAFPVMADEAVPAFPGAEGHGRYVTGGRGGKVIHVTNLNDSGTGSLRAAVKGNDKKIIVFDVSGYIDLKSDLTIGSNTTILGQTAPEGGITVRYFTLKPAKEGATNNVIVRFIRSRRSQVKNVNDGADAVYFRRCKDLMFDHCSFSWSIDEVASFYDNRNFTMQWCTVAEGLANPGHSKGAHSYGGIWGGKNASFHHNFIAHVQNRAPRFNGARYGWDGYDDTKYINTVDAERVDFRNCLIYNWGTGGCYGGPGGGYINMVNNYYKAGPGTKHKTRVTEVSVCSSGNGDSKHPELYGYSSRYFISGNYVASASEPAGYDWKGVSYDSGLYTANGERYIKDADHKFGENQQYLNVNGTDYINLKLDEPTDYGMTTTHGAEGVYENILNYCGASLYRDGTDARYFEEARTGTVTYYGDVAYKDINGKVYPTSKTKGILDFINDPDGTIEPKTAEYPVLASNTRPAGYDTDGDGIPDEWERAHGLDPAVNDANGYTLDSRGWYTNIEVYANSLVEHIMKGGNADAIDAVDEYYPELDKSGIADIEMNAVEVERIEYYNLHGVRLAEPAQGINIRRIIYTDGRVESDKVIK